MNYEQLAVWLQGMFEYRDVSSIGHQECRNMLQGIKDHVALTFNKVTPNVDWSGVSGKAAPKDNAEPKKESIDEILKRHVIKPTFPQTPPFAPFPSYPLPYSDKDKYWLDRPNTGLGVITC